MRPNGRAGISQASAGYGGNIMAETYPLDIAAEQIVSWLTSEERLHGLDLLVSASRAYWAGDVKGGKARWLSDSDREDVSDIVEVGLLEVSPKKAPHRWTLRVRVEDDIGPRLPEDEPVPEAAEEIDLATFHAEFIRADRGLAEVSVEVESPAAKADFTRSTRS
jgi:hypothetical protein